MAGRIAGAAVAILLACPALWPAQALAGEDEAAPAGRYQIVRASESRVWRLDTATGEISVCTLSGERLICSTSSEAVTPPQTSYEQLRAERETREQAEAERQIALIDRIMTMIRELMAYTIRSEHDQEQQPGDGQQ